MPETLQQPSFSVIVGCYNHSAFIRETVNSVLSQTFPPLQVIVVDDASPDFSVDVLKEFGDGILLVALTQNGGGSAARNCGAALATGDYVVFLDGDDALAPWALEVYARLVTLKRPAIILASMFFFNGPSVDTSRVYWNGQDRSVDYDARAADITFVDYGTLVNKDRTFRSSGTSMVMERAAFWNAGGWTADIFPGEDTDLQLKMLYDKPALHILSPPTAYCRLHSDNTMKQVSRFINGLRIVMRKAKTGAYTGKHGRKREVYSLLGGEVWFWVKRALKNRNYSLAANLLVEGFPIITVATVRRIAARLFGVRMADVIPSLASGAPEPGSRVNAD